MPYPISAKRNRRQSGNSLLEFGLVSLWLLPLALGFFEISMGLTKFIQVQTVTRDAGSIFVRGGDFSAAGYQKIMGRIAIGMGVTNSDYTINNTSTSKGIIILTQLMRIGNSQCLAGGYTAPNYTGCTNKWKVVVIKRVYLGNQALRSSDFGTPSPTLLASDGSITQSRYLTDPSVVSTLFPVGTSEADVPTTPVAVGSGEVLYGSESYFVDPALNLFPQIINLSGYYARFIF